MKVNYLLVDMGERTIIRDKEVLLTTKSGNLIIEVSGKETLIPKERVLSKALIKEYDDILHEREKHYAKLKELAEKLEKLEKNIFFKG